MDHTTIHPSCEHLAHRIDLHLWRGAPRNLDEGHPVEILVNEGYVVGFCPARLQPAWSAYRVAHADQDVDYDRPLVYYDDMRLPAEHRIGRNTFGKVGGIQLNVGHMSPNEVINRQFGRLAQLETFFMSNMSPQYGSLNSGVWLKLEDAIREIEDEPGKDHVWTIVGPVFGEEPVSLQRGAGKNLPIPDAYFCVTVDPQRWPWDRRSVVELDCFIIPQDAPRSNSPEDYVVTLAEVEAATNLSFFPGWGEQHRHAALATTAGGPRAGSRLMKVLRSGRESAEHEAVAGAQEGVRSLRDLIAVLRAEAGRIQRLGRALSAEERARLQSIQQIIAYLVRAAGMIEPTPEPEPMPATLITYKIESDLGDKLTHGARTACNFWNRFVQPSRSIVIRAGVFTEDSNTIARAYRPYTNGDTAYGRVQFNTVYLADFTADQIAGTIVHEIGHTLGIGWSEWRELFDRDTGRFTADAVSRLASLANMEVERDGGDGTRLSHWDEETFDRELMTGYQDHGEHVLPVTIDVMELLGHGVKDRLPEQAALSGLLEEAANVIFSRHGEALQLDLDYLEETEILETIPHPGAADRKR